MKRTFKDYLPLLLCWVIGAGLFIAGTLLVVNNAEIKANDNLVLIGGIIASIGFGSCSTYTCIWSLNKEK